ncbi:MAG: SLC45 family MFS transporter, partial [Gammaproteobacteria bacterium]|nr:SLC45 family MFS transporter [Gammaproteobacteria bacterium]
MTTFWFGVHFAEAVSVNLLPLTLYLFTENAFYIGLILAINPMFGFVAQPVVGVLSDRTWTRVGRRAFYLIVAAPQQGGPRAWEKGRAGGNIIKERTPRAE